ncbi:hypothetical protein OK348_08015 [Flavobacterium sp. MXW15]|uniref:Lipase n=1 Tax=Xanthomonas chitinilytica TaxID=2989819 RepID=A0ABT3JUV6_9XANT|nr:lipase [Xanthomonas sp. H13-6]MCW4454740.1 hypothetical protein [Flavobacterium sp. MXW15]MCW4471979.1 lipase [Xanthomonas sp. H13-6]
MTQTTQQNAYLSDDTYSTPNETATGEYEPVTFDGVKYNILAHVDRPSGYQGTIYQRFDAGQIIVAHRGTEFDRELIKDGAITDGAMVASRINPQVKDALELTKAALDFASRDAKPQENPLAKVTVTGHSLGGCLAQITAHHYGLKGEAFNPYGAVSLGYRIPEGPQDSKYEFTNHVMAGDAVSAASPHYGEVVTYALPREIESLQAAGFRPGMLGTLSHLAPVAQPIAAATTAVKLGDSHRIHNFLNVDAKGAADISVLADPKARELAATHKEQIDDYREAIGSLRGGATVLLGNAPNTAKHLYDQLRGPLPPGAPAGLAPERQDIRDATPRTIHTDTRCEQAPAPWSPPLKVEASSSPLGNTLDRLLAASRDGDSQAFSRLTHDLAQQPAGVALRMEAVEKVDQQERQAVEQAAQQAAMQERANETQVRAMHR